MSTARHLEPLVREACATGHGFLPILELADGFGASHSPKECLDAARALLQREQAEARMLAVFLLGALAGASRAALDLLRAEASREEDWRVREIVAKAFDRCCAETGYAGALPLIRSWLGDPAPGVRRAVTEGLRIWTSRGVFKKDPGLAVALLAGLKGDVDASVRRSVGNALKDISKRHASLVAREIRSWDLGHPRIRQTAALAGKKIGVQKRAPSGRRA